MVETMGRTYTPKERIENLLYLKQTLFPKQPLDFDWEYLLDEFIKSFGGHPRKNVIHLHLHVRHAIACESYCLQSLA